MTVTSFVTANNFQHKFVTNGTKKLYDFLYDDSAITYLFYETRFLWYSKLPLCSLLKKRAVSI
jgi:hypothetical protein